MTTRRDLLKGAASGGIAAAALAAFPESIRRALAIPAFHETGTIKDVKHVVILMQENRAFDLYFGTYKGVRGFGDRFTIPLPDGRAVWEQLNANGKVLLHYHLDETKGNAQRANGTPHTWVDSHNAWDGGRMYQWPRYKNQISMGYFDQAEVPFHRALADAFTICDDYHAALITGTGANRAYHMSGTNGPTGAGVAFVNNTPWTGISPDITSDIGYQWKTYPERLEEAGVSWLIYMVPPFAYNAPNAFVQYRKANEALPPERRLIASNDPFVQPGYDPADAVAQPLIKGFANTMPLANQATLDSGAFLDTFRNDVKNGRLPAVSWIMPPDDYSEHPASSSPVQGAWLIQEILDALTAVPEVWSKTVFLVNYDENDGYFDHVPPAAPPSPRGDGTYAGKTTLTDDDLSYEYYTHPLPPGLAASTQPKGGPDGDVYGPGPRVPLLVISPWSRGGWVNSQAFDHSSVIRFLEARFGAKEPNISPYRRAVSGDLTTAFNFAHPNSEPLPELEGRKTKDEADALRAAQQALPAIKPPAGRGFPVQETGARPSRALPYAVHANAHVDAASGTVRLLFANTGFVGAVFHVYDKKHLDRLPQRYMVEPFKALDDTWTPAPEDNGQYDLWVLGPNGYNRHFQGDVTQVQAQHAPNAEIFAGYDVFGGGLHLQLCNDGGGKVNFTVKSNQIYAPLSAVTCAVSAFGPMPAFPGFGPRPGLMPVGFGGAPGFGFGPPPGFGFGPAPGFGFGPAPGFGAPVFGAPGFGFPQAPGFVPGPVVGGGPNTSWTVPVFAGRPGELYWNLSANGFWYDFEITCDADSSFYRRIAGRVETGRHSVTDPGMGLADQF